MPTFLGGNEIVRFVYKDSNGDVKEGEVGRFKNSSGVVATVWERGTHQEAASGVGGGSADPNPDPEPDPLPDDEAITTNYGVTLNIDQIQAREVSAGTETAHITTYLNTLQTRTNTIGFKYNVERDDLQQVLAFGAAFAVPNWFNLWAGHPFSSGAFFVMHWQPHNQNGWPGVSAGSLSAQAAFTLTQMMNTYTTMKANLQWNVYARTTNATMASKLRIILSHNEPDNIGIGSGLAGINSYASIIRDFLASENTDLGKQLARKRAVFVQKVVYEQLRAISQHAQTTTPNKSNMYCGWPTLTFSTRTLADANQRIFFNDMCKEFDGEILSYVDIVSVHLHRVMSNIDSYDNQPPADNAQSMYHIWKILQETNTIRVAAGKSQRNLPCMIDEAGLLINSPTGWDDGVDEIPVPSAGTPTYVYDRGSCAFRLYRTGMMLLNFGWYGLVCHLDYVVAYSGAYNYYGWQPNQGINDTVDGLPMQVMHDWREHLKTWDPTLYDINLFTQGSFPQKSWNEYYKAYSWGAFIPMGSAAVNSRASGLPPYNGWRNITFNASGIVTMTSTFAVTRNMIFRLIWLRKPTVAHKVSVEINFPTSNVNAKAKLRVRGYNKLNGLAESAVEVIGNDAQATGSAWKSVSVTVTHTGHGLTSINDVNTMLVALDHNGVGTVNFRNPRIDYVTS